MASQPDLVTPAPAQAQARRRGMTAWICAALLMVVGGFLGLRMQHELWNTTKPIRFQGDIGNCYVQGWRAQYQGLFNVYHNAAGNARERGDGSLDYDLDYPPLRLTVAWLWTGWTARHFPPAQGWQNTWEFHWPLLAMNRAFLAIAAISAMGLVMHFRRLGKSPPAAGRGAICGAVAALLVWFSLPANLVGFAWPQWDICVPAFFLAALLAGCRRWWILAGASLATGGMYKGQVLIALPLFVLWPIVAGEWRGLIRLALGFVLAAGVITAPFMFQGTLWAVGILAGVMVAIVGVGVLHRHGTSRWWWLLILLAGVAAWPARTDGGMTGALLASVIAAGLFALAALLPRRDLASLIAAGIAAAIWLPACLMPEPWDWLNVGLLYGTHHFQAMIMGPASTFPAVLATRFGVRDPNEIAFAVSAYEVTWKALLRMVFLAGMVLCGTAMGIHHRRGNPRFLLAAVTPWVLFATIPAQIHERYPMYCALASATFVALGFRWTLVHLGLAVISGATVLHALLLAGQPFRFLPQQDGPSLGIRLLQIVQPMHPDVAWAMLVFCGLCLWCAMDVRRPTILTGVPAGTESSLKPRGS